MRALDLRGTTGWRRLLQRDKSSSSNETIYPLTVAGEATRADFAPFTVEIRVAVAATRLQEANTLPPRSCAAVSRRKGCEAALTMAPAAQTGQIIAVCQDKQRKDSTDAP